ncbi:MAG: hypothetical protein FJW88_07640 [Actinobacteria bacterium]|nr:hypothetical protein [Actinomycetota bacterium]
MSSLWTPYGEEPVGPGAAPAPGGSPDGPPGEPEQLDPAELREMLARLATTPVEAIVTQFAVELQEICVLHLGLAAERPGSLAQAGLALDAMAALSEGLGDRLAPNAEPLRQGVAQLRLAYVEVASQGARGADQPAEDDSSS